MLVYLPYHSLPLSARYSVAYQTDQMIFEEEQDLSILIPRGLHYNSSNLHDDYHRKPTSLVSGGLLAVVDYV